MTFKTNHNIEYYMDVNSSKWAFYPYLLGTLRGVFSVKVQNEGKMKVR